MKHLYTFLFAALFSVTSAFAQSDTVAIDSINYLTAADLGNCIEQSPRLGDTVTFRGIVMFDGDQYGSGSHNINIQRVGGGPWSGIALRDGDGSGYTTEMVDLFEGWEVWVTGTVNEYQGQTQVTPLQINDAIVVESTGNALTIDTIPLSELNDNQGNNNLVDGEEWESAYVTLEDLEVISVDFFSGNRVSFNVNDDQGNFIRVGDWFKVQKLPSYPFPDGTGNGSFSPPSVGDQFNFISGILQHELNNCPGGSGIGFEMNPFKPSHYVYGPSAPRISNVTKNPDLPTSSQSVTVTADIVDLDGSIASATLYYNTGTDVSNTNFTAVTMSNTSGSTYSATIPSFSDGTFVRWYLTATDDSTNTTGLPGTDPTQNSYMYRVRDNGLTIYDIQYTPYSNGNSPFTGSEVTVTGVVTASAQQGDLGYVYIQDENSLGGWSGILLTQNAGLANLSRGDKVEVTGTVRESFGHTRLESISNITNAGSGTIEPFYLAPDTFTSYSFSSNEQFEGMLIGLINEDTSLGGGKVHVVEANADAPSNFAEWRVGRDPFDPNSGCRVITGRKTGSAFSSYNVSYVNDSSYLSNLLIPGLIISDTVNMDTLIGNMYYSFGNLKLSPRNNDDFIGINLMLPDTSGGNDTNTTNIQEMLWTTQNNAFEVYPIPTNNEITIDTDMDGATHTILIQDIQGRELFKRITKEEDSKLYLNTLGKGSYFISLYDENETYMGTEKVIVE